MTRSPVAPFRRDPSEPYDANTAAYLDWHDAITGIRLDKVRRGELPPDESDDYERMIAGRM